MAEATAKPAGGVRGGSGPGLLGTIGDGAMAGLYGAATVALWFFLVDLWLREPFYTPSLVGTAIFTGVVDPAASPDLAIVSVLTVIHALAFILFGMVYAGVLSRLKQTPDFPLIAISVFVPLELGFVLGIRLLAPEIPEVIGHGFIAFGNALAAVATALYLRFGQPHPEDLE